MTCFPETVSVLISTRAVAIAALWTVSGGFTIDDSLSLSIDNITLGQLGEGARSFSESAAVPHWATAGRAGTCRLAVGGIGGRAGQP
ncbi:hypothetical protein Acy02nite_47190 [Actinoplanes cyaneus]|uniref:Uncharacterized protein n=1 Tax=Actinoplanes cyaneus TaxID=52696 RepID=A0A919INX4_9ACTN|nr:hypothetical protein Acy02nite_47190 [Actinoplanes cyaneus]